MTVRRLILLCLLPVLIPLQADGQSLRRTPSGHPDLQGIWQARTRAAVNLEDHVARNGMPAGFGVVEGGAIPYKDSALAQRRANFENRESEDPLNKCYMPGVPRIMAMDFPFEIFQADQHIAITFEWTQVYRLIYTGGQEPLYPGFEHWMGDSRGHWEGDTLVVEVSDLNDRTWLDASGNFHSSAMHVTEHYSLLDENTIKYEANIDDPEVFTRPWTIRFNLYRQTGMKRLLEYQCQAEAEEASGDFERVDRLWYPAPVPAENVPFDAAAGIDIPLPAVPRDIDRTAGGSPDITGYYTANAGGANYGLEKRGNLPLFPPTRGVVIDPPDGVLPYQDWARTEQMERREPWRGYDDPTAHCFLAAGVPRSFYVPSPFFILQTPGYVVMLHERMAYRVIPLGSREHLPDNLRLWMGDSVGHWEGEPSAGNQTLVVETTNFNGKMSWLNELGDVVSHAETVVETFTPVSDSQLLYRATVSDPIAYSRPWTIEMPFNRQDEELLEVACLEDNNDLQHLKDVRDEHRAMMGNEE